MFKNVLTSEGQPFFYELPLLRNESPALALSWTLQHVLDEDSLSAEDLEAQDVSVVMVVSGYDVVAAQTVHARKSSGTAMPTFSALPRTDATTAGSMILSKASLKHSTRV
jgi:hypothetical protein